MPSIGLSTIDLARATLDQIAREIAYVQRLLTSGEQQLAQEKELALEEIEVARERVRSHPYVATAAPTAAIAVKEPATVEEPTETSFREARSLSAAVVEMVAKSGRSWTPKDVTEHLVTTYHIDEVTKNPQALVAQALSRGVRNGQLVIKGRGNYSAPT